MSDQAEPRIHNPYAKKKSSFARKPLHLQDDLLDESSSSNPAEERSAPPETLSREMSSGNSSRRDEIQDSSRTSSSSSNETTASFSVQDAAPQQQRPPSSSSNNLPMWQRLPSQTITFGSAEILTIPEACQRLADASGNSATSSIRITGVVANKHVHADGSVSLVLGDPLAPLRKAQSSILKRKRPLASKTPAGDAKTTEAITKTPATTASSTTSTKKTPASTASSTAKTPGVTFQVPAKRPQSILFNSKKKNLVYKKKTTGRRLSFAAGGLVKKRSPLELLVQTLSAGGNSARIWVVVPSNSQQEAIAVNDLVMVMGEVQHVNNNNNNTENNAPTLLCAAVTEVTATTQTNTTTTTTAHAPQSYVRARIVRNANGTNMKLYTDALMARRAFLGG